MGLIFNVQRFCTNDGDGIRTTVFLKGCPLSCPWCHNPESTSGKAQLSYSKNLCIGCKSCVAVCPSNLIRLTERGVEIDKNCNLCGECVCACPTTALELVGKTVTAKEVISIALKDKDYYKNGGGITISGGEPLFQPRFTLEIACLAKEKGLNVVIETSGVGDNNALKQILPFTDCFLFDFKCEIKDYLNIVGVNFEVVENNLKTVASGRVILRCPILPQVQGDNYFFEIAKLCNKYHLKEVHFLPYHNLGVSKTERFFMDKQKQFTTPTAEFLLSKKKLVEDNCLAKVIIQN